jgi:hypothetical protein
MARKYRKIDPRIWSDEKFCALKSAEDKLIVLYCLTCPQCNRAGIFRFSPALASEDLHWSIDSYLKRFANVVSRMKWRWDEGSRVLYFPTWWRYNEPENQNHLKGCLTDLDDLPQTSLLQDFANNTTHLPGYLLDTFREAIAKRMPNQEQEQELEQEQEQEQEEDSSEIAPRVSEPAVPVLQFPVVGKGPTEWTLTESMLTEYREAYPGIDALQEARNARQWCIANARKRKTHAGMPAFLTRWLAKAQNSAQGGASPPRNGKDYSL